jgi:hypothetical protein
MTSSAQTRVTRYAVAATGCGAAPHPHMLVGHGQKPAKHTQGLREAQ